MRRLRTQGIVLARTNYGEADRILTFLTPDQGKLKAIAKGVRKTKSKLAGGLELFSVSDISFIPARKEISTIVSTRLVKHYSAIVEDLARTSLAYELLKRINSSTEDEPEPAYFYLLQNALEALNDSSISPELTELWFNMQLLRLSGHMPDLRTDTEGQKLVPTKHYSFDFEKMHFAQTSKGKFSADHIKFLRLGFSPNTAHVLNRIKGSSKFVSELHPVVQPMLQAYIRI